MIYNTEIYDLNEDMKVTAFIKFRRLQSAGYTRVGQKVSGLTYKSCAKWKMLRGIYSAIYGEVNVSVSVCVEIKGDYIEK